MTDRKRDLRDTAAGMDQHADHGDGTNCPPHADCDHPDHDEELAR